MNNIPFVGLHAHSGVGSIFDGLGKPDEHMDFAYSNGADALDNPMAAVNQWFLLTLTNLDSQTPSYQGYSINGAALTRAMIIN